MKTGIIFTSILAIITLASAVSAQHIKAFDGNGNSIFRNVNGTWTVLSSKVSVGPPLEAGKTIRLRIAATNNRNRDGASGAELRSFFAYETFAVSCGDDNRRAAQGVSSAQLTLVGSMSEPVYEWKTDPAWKGTCRILAVKIASGREVRSKFRFE